MIAKKFKLPIQNFVGQSGKVIRNPHFTIKVFTTNNNFSRFGLVISKKVDASAVKRNRLKRLAFDLIQKIAEKLPVNDYLIFFSPSAGKLNEDQFIREIKNIFNQTIS
ncbi:MAG: ribonuclease P protein component [Patescibacteria group bacterium]